MVGETNSMVGYHLMTMGWGGGGCCEPLRWWRLEFFENFFEYRPLKDV